MTRLLVSALAEELKDFDPLLTGVGKVNATLALTRRLADGPLVTCVVNLGSAGGVGLPCGQVVQVSEFHQWDMRCEGLGYARGETPFDPMPAVLRPTLAEQVAGIESVPCYTGDAFLDTPAMQPPGPCVVDMEAYALAKVCAAFGVPFAAYKFITDGADGSAAEDWPSALEKCSQALGIIASKLTTS